MKKLDPQPNINFISKFIQLNLLNFKGLINPFE